MYNLASFSIVSLEQKQTSPEKKIFTSEQQQDFLKKTLPRLVVQSNNFQEFQNQKLANTIIPKKSKLSLIDLNLKKNVFKKSNFSTNCYFFI